MTAIVDRLAIIGVGLIGGSFALALREAGAVNYIIGAGRSSANLRDALSLSIIDEATQDPAEAAAGADVVFISTPIRTFAALARAIGPALKPGAIVTDAGSAKEIAGVELFAHLPPHARIVPGHPIAGSEKTGASSARADLFRGRRTILTPNGISDPEAVALVTRLWQAAGAQVETMDAHLHDLVLGAVSHLPHMVAYALVETVLRWDRETPMIRFSAGGLRDFTRVAASSAEMWADICLDNQDAILQALDRFAASLGELRGLIAAGRSEELRDWFERGREARRRMAGDA